MKSSCWKLITGLLFFRSSQISVRHKLNETFKDFLGTKMLKIYEIKEKRYLKEGKLKKPNGFTYLIKKQTTKHVMSIGKKIPSMWLSSFYWMIFASSKDQEEVLANLLGLFLYSSCLRSKSLGKRLWKKIKFCKNFHGSQIGLSIKGKLPFLRGHRVA